MSTPCPALLDRAEPALAPTPQIRFRLQGRFGDFALDVEAALPAAGVTALIGPSGSGKTTLLRGLAGLARMEGEVVVGEAVWQAGGRFLPTHRRGVGYVFQDASLLPHLSVRRNLAYAERRARLRQGLTFDAAVEMLGLGRLLDRAPAALSGGERQRASIARALLGRPALLLMDEPLSSLDADSKAEVMPFLEQLHRALALPVIYVSHDVVEVARLADRVLQIAHGRLLGPARPVARGDTDPLAQLGESRIRALARAALSAGLEAAP